MAGASTSLHEPTDRLSPLTRDLHRALVSLQEELEAVDWYRQRAEGTEDAELRDLLLHNMREEVEHALMLLEWVRRHSGDFDRKLRTYLFTSAPITETEAQAGEEPAAETPRERGASTVGAMKGAECAT